MFSGRPEQTRFGVWQLKSLYGTEKPQVLITTLSPKISVDAFSGDPWSLWYCCDIVKVLTSVIMCGVLHTDVKGRVV